MTKAAEAAEAAMTAAAAAVVAAAVVGKDDKGGGSLFSYGVVVKKILFAIFSILMSGKEAVCPDGLLFVPYSKGQVSILTV